MTERHRIEFRLAENPWAPTAVIEEINDREGCGLQLVGLADQLGGTSSAAYVRWPDGREAALTRTKVSLDVMRMTAEVLEIAYGTGLPVPRHQLVMGLEDRSVAVVQERLPGSHVDQVDMASIDALIEANERLAGVLKDRPDVPVPEAFPPSGYSTWRATLGQHSARGRDLLDRVRVLDGADAYRMSGDDLVHVDFILDNVLFDEQGQVSGIVDWNRGAARGDRRFALIGLRRYLVHEAPEIVAHLDAALDGMMDAATLRIYIGHHLVHRAHRSIENGFSVERIDSDIAEATGFLV